MKMMRCVDGQWVLYEALRMRRVDALGGSCFLVGDDASLLQGTIGESCSCCTQKRAHTPIPVCRASVRERRRERSLRRHVSCSMEYLCAILSISWHKNAVCFFIFG